MGHIPSKHWGDTPRFLGFSALFCAILVLFAGLSDRLLPPRAVSADESPSAPVVVLDAGHGGEDGGAIGANGVYEKDLNLSIVLSVGELLRANGISVVLTRDRDILLYDRNSDYHGQKKVQDLAARRAIAEEQENAVFVSIHMNSFPQPQYSGLQVWYSPHHPSSKDLAERIRALTQKALLPDNDRALKAAGRDIYLLDRLTCPAVLVECGFLSNPEECARLSDEAYRQQLALILSLAILENLSSAAS